MSDDPCQREPVWWCGRYVAADYHDRLIAAADAAPEWTPETVAKLRVLLRPDPVKPGTVPARRSARRAAPPT